MTMSKLPIPSQLGILFVVMAMAGSGCDDGPCASDADCRSGARCAPDGRCIPGAACVAEIECTDQDPRTFCNLETFTCDLREGFADECDADRPCVFGQFCSELLGRCLDSASSRDCVRRSQCPANQICDRTASKCIPDIGCFGNAFCEEGETCDLVNRVCRTLSLDCVSCFGTGTCESAAQTCAAATRECLADQAEPACLPNEICDPLGRCVQCTRSAQCGPGLFCNTSVGRCESNIQCANDPSQCPDSPQVMCILCTLPEICDPRTRRCQAPPTLCENDSNCTEEEFCDLTLDLPICVPRVPDCFNDVLDEPPNDRPTAARTLEPSAGPIYDELKLCPGDQDWYRVDVVAGTYLTIDARFEHDLGDLELQLWLPDGTTLVDESRTVTDNERVELEVGTDLSVLVRAFFATPNVRDLPYRLVATRDQAEACPDDGAEPNDDPTQAGPLATNQTFEGRLCSADPDWFVLQDVTPASRVTLLLSFVDNLGDLDIEVFRPGASQPLLAAASTSDNESLQFDAPYGGDFFVRVFGRAADTNVYTLRARVEPGAGVACLDDAFEPNDTLQTASATSADQIPALAATMCQGDDDWYVTSLVGGQALLANLGMDPGVDLELKLYPPGTTDENATPIAASTGVIPRESLGLVVPEDGDYLLRVEAVDDLQITPYTLSWRNFDLNTCEPDPVDDLGRGNSDLDPFPLSAPPTARHDLQLCPANGDEDWFQISAPTGFLNILRLSFVPSQALFELELWDLDGNRLADTQTLPPSNVGELRLTPPGTPGASAPFLVHIITSLDAGGPYALSHDIIPIFPCASDGQEPNNSVENASLTASSSAAPTLLEDLTLCASMWMTNESGEVSGDEDWFVINPPAAGALMEASITFERGDLFLELRSPGGAVRACRNLADQRCFSDGNDFREWVAFTATVAAPYLLRVGSVYGSPATGEPSPEFDTPYELRVEHTVP